ncbi:LSU ribosomal protein L3P [Kushneria sinocarnis]|uniref:Large ribosomal subunit protein uL3 n=1 Tax=Kushneria sinocarnis TaxID=595502 RepID=A0A420WT54_9GAMM|nr:50S ribosomal protein L3 [Kushneria sinocarnis]RKQ95902.1 LSU ribosomal protein L3P [Kushneria sinocarnis]
MSIGLVGRKSGMTRIFTEAGASVPVTVIEVEPNRVTAVRTLERDGYRAVQVTTGSRKSKHLTRAVAGQFAQAGVEAGRSMTEFRLADADEDPSVGSEFNVSLFEAGQRIDVIGKSKGKGYQGAVKRWNFRTQDNTHGNSLSHRAPGSIGQCQTPGRVFKGKKMAGQLGNERVTVQGLEIVRVDAERNLLLVKGSVPGHTGSELIVRSAVKAR